MRVLVPASLLVSFAANDGEELATMSETMSGALARLLRHLRGAPEEVEAVRRRMREVLPGQTWQARARQVAIELTGPTGGAVPQPAREGV